MFQSLHHVPIAAMGAAFDETHRVLRFGGDRGVGAGLGPVNDVMRLFHDEGAVRASAQQAVELAQARGLFRLERRVDFFAPDRFLSSATWPTRAAPM